MRKIFALFLFFCSMALAANSGPENIKNLSLCFRLASVQVEPEMAQLIPNLQNDLFEKISTKLKAYRIAYSEGCSITNEQIFLLAETIQAGNGTLVYHLEMNVFEYDLKPNFVTIYNLGSFGTTASRGNELGSKTINTFSGMIDDFAADYAVANP